MKKILMLQVFAVIALVSQAWGAYSVCTDSYAGYCRWDLTASPSDCGKIGIDPAASWSKKTCKEAYENCEKNGYLYSDTACATWSGIGNNPDFNDGVPIWCQWASGCQPIKTQTDLTKCKKDGSVYKEVDPIDVGDNQKCKSSGIWTGEGKDPNAIILGCCNWEGAGCFQVTLATEWAHCAAQYRYETCPGDEVGTCVGSPIPVPSSSSIVTTPPSSSSSTPAATPSSSSSNVVAGTSSSSSTTTTQSSSSGAGTTSSSGTGGSSSSDDGTPIISHNSAPVVGLNVVNFARSLRIASDKNATISLFDINGKYVLSQNVLSGTTTISLGKQKVGVYYAVVKSSSQKQIVKIVLK